MTSKFIFELYDKDEDDELDVIELKTLVAQLKSTAKALERENPTHWINALLSKLDTDKSGTISKQEWIEEGSKSPTLLVLLGVNSPI